MTRELWAATVEVVTNPSDTGDTRAFTNAVSWASSASEYSAVVREVFESYGWVLIGVENCRPVSHSSEAGAELAELIQRAQSNPNACIYGTFHYYPSRAA